MIQVENLTYRYPKGDDHAQTYVLDGIDIKIQPGEFVAVVGHNGSGKSTLAKHFNGILLPAGGKVYIDSLDTADRALLFEIRRRVGMVFQNPDNQIVATIVEEDVAFAPENLGVAPEEIRRRVDWALKAVGMYDKRMHAPHLLSGGQKQRVAIAGVLAMTPAYIVLDEPTAMLDPVGRREVLDTVLKLNRQEHMTVILITHFMEEAALADRVLVMQDGRICMQGTPKEVFVQARALKSMGLDVPQTIELMYALKAAGLNVALDTVTAEECAEEIMKLI